ncbi:MAG: dTDP-4-dehydrorhamnose reductase [Thermomicrobiales bacterium]
MSHTHWLRERVLVTGAGGQLGTELRRVLTAAGYGVVGIGSTPRPGVDLVVDLQDRAAVAHAVGEIAPLAVIHAAAYTDVDGCERDPARADAVNHRASADLAELASDAGIWMLAVGTDFVFPGDGGAPYAEDAPTRPLSVYGASKLAGEQAVLAADAMFAVARTAWVFGGAGKHFPRTVLNVVAQRGGMEVVEDEVGGPTYAPDLADALVRVLPHRPSGLLHLTNAGSVSRFGLAQAVVAAAGGDPAVIQPTTTSAFLAKYPLPATRPANSTLANTRAAAIGVTLPPWEDAVRRYAPILAAETGFASSKESDA